jgi:acyl-CoA hydrolase
MRLCPIYFFPERKPQGGVRPEARSDFMTGFQELYQQKCVSAEKAVAIIRSGDVVDYGFFNGKPVVCDQALAARHGELRDVYIHTAVTIPPVPEVIKYPKSFVYHDLQFSKLTRVLKSSGFPAYYLPIMYHQAPAWFRDRVADHRNVVICAVCPMDRHGYFNLGPHPSATLAAMEEADTVILEVVQDMPRCLGGAEESVHISQVDYVVEAPEDQKMADLPTAEPSQTDRDIASHIMPFIHDGSCLQLGIGGMPNAVGKIIADSDLKDLGGHTEMLSDAYVDMLLSGRMTGQRKPFDKGRVAYTFALGSRRLYNFMDNNPAVSAYPASYTNDPRVIGQIDDFISINNALQVDLYSQINAESLGTTQVSGNGGMWDFVIGAQWSKNGKSFICLASTYKDSQGNLRSRVMPRLKEGSIVTIPRHQVDYVVTEFGAARMRAQSTWSRAERIIGLAHPDFRESLVQEAETMGIWRQSNKKDA